MKEKLLGKDLRSISKANEVVKIVETQEQFDELFSFLYVNDRLLMMRSIDAIEKIVRKYPEFLETHKEELLRFSRLTNNIEFKWHLALLFAKMTFDNREQTEVFKRLTKWAMDCSESKIVRVNAIQALHDMTLKNPNDRNEFLKMIASIKKEQIPSLNARIEKLID